MRKLISIVATFFDYVMVISELALQFMLRENDPDSLQPLTHECLEWTGCKEHVAASCSRNKISTCTNLKFI